jgi:hypothetical protein
MVMGLLILAVMVLPALSRKTKKAQELLVREELP